MGTLEINNLGDAVKWMAERYAILSQQAATMVALSKASGRSISPNLLADYDRSWKDYRRFSGDVFAELAKHKFHVEQILRRAGRPVTDPKNPTGYKTIVVDAPLMPPTFSATASAGDDVGIDPVTLGVLIFGTFLVVGTAGIVGYQMLKQYRFLRQGPDFEAGESIRNDMQCAENWIKKGLSPVQAAEHCKIIVTPSPGTSQSHPRSEDSKDIGLGGALLGFGAIAGGAYLITHWPKKAA